MHILTCEMQADVGISSRTVFNTVREEMPTLQVAASWCTGRPAYSTLPSSVMRGYSPPLVGLVWLGKSKLDGSESGESHVKWRTGTHGANFSPFVLCWTMKLAPECSFSNPPKFNGRDAVCFELNLLEIASESLTISGVPAKPMSSTYTFIGAGSG